MPLWKQFTLTFKICGECTKKVNSEIMIYEDRLGYAMNCPVTITKIDTDETVDGIIAHPELEWDEDGKQTISMLFNI